MITDMVLKQLGMCNFVFKANLGDITHEESLVQPQPAGNCANWVMGHVIVYRSQLINGLDGKPYWDEADYKVYERNAAPLTEAANAKPLAELWTGLEETLALIETAVKKLTPADLAEQAPFIQDVEPGGTVESALTIFSFHDAYHAGQTGVIRRVIGKPPADL